LTGGGQTVTLCTSTTDDGQHVSELHENPPVVSLALPFAAGEPVPLHLARVSFTIDGNRQEGVLNGGIREPDVQRYFVPPLASIPAKSR
jgi:hypothetical protein